MTFVVITRLVKGRIRHDIWEGPRAVLEKRVNEVADDPNRSQWLLGYKYYPDEED